MLKKLKDSSETLKDSPVTKEDAITFYDINKENHEIGRLYRKEGKLCFSGDIDASAKILFDMVVEMYNNQDKSDGKE